MALKNCMVIFAFLPVKTAGTMNFNISAPECIVILTREDQSHVSENVFLVSGLIIKGVEHYKVKAESVHSFVPNVANQWSITFAYWMNH